MSNEKFKNIIKDCYVKILKRQADQEGLEYFLDIMKKGKITEKELILQMKESEEYKDIESMNNFIKKYDLLCTNEDTKKKLQEFSKIGDTDKLISNFFWHGEKFGFLNNIVIKSHLKVGHHPKIWITGKKPSNKYWKEIEKNVTVIDISKYFNVKEFLSFGGNLQVASDLWRFHFLYACGGFYSDLDNFVLKHFPDDEWVVCAPEKEPNLLGIGFIKCPPNSKIFLNSISNLKIHWGGVDIFNEAYRNIFRNTNSTHIGKYFYPYHWTESQKLFENIEVYNEIYAIHFYQSKIEYDLKEKYDKINEVWCIENKNTLLARLFAWLNNNN